MKGVYVAYFRIEEATGVEIGALGEITFERGLYAYVGSAMNGVEKRLERHFSEDKKNHWHIDYFSRSAEPAGYFILPEDGSYECVLADILSGIGEPVDGFGASDCGCSSHLFQIPE